MKMFILTMDQKQGARAKQLKGELILDLDSSVEHKDDAKWILILLRISAECINRQLFAKKLTISALKYCFCYLQVAKMAVIVGLKWHNHYFKLPMDQMAMCNVKGVA